MRNVND